MRLVPDRKSTSVLLALLSVLAIITLLAALKSTYMPGRQYHGEMKAFSPEEEILSQRLRSHVERLAGEIGQRHMEDFGSLELSATYITDSLTSAGYEVRMLPYTDEGLEVNNIEAELKGSSGDLVIVGAHYDTVPGTKGANDNASGVAAVLELARIMNGHRPLRTVRFVLFANEEPPYFKTDRMGSHVYASSLKAQGQKVSAMLSLETIGFYMDAPGSQLYPSPLDLFYPDTGNFIAFVGNMGSRRLIKQVIGAFRETVDFPSEGAAVPGFLPGVDWSDHWSFWQNGYPGIMVTDTAPYRYPHYHTGGDTPEKLDYTRMARVVIGLEGALLRLASK